jgi:hypothetical protein
MDAETTPAFMDFKLDFKSTGEPVYEDPKRQYRLEGFKRPHRSSQRWVTK